MKEPAPIRWRKGELIGAGAYGRVYMGMNLESGELIAVKQVRTPPMHVPISCPRKSNSRIGQATLGA